MPDNNTVSDEEYYAYIDAFNKEQQDIGNSMTEEQKKALFDDTMAKLNNDLKGTNKLNICG